MLFENTSTNSAERFFKNNITKAKLCKKMFVII